MAGMRQVCPVGPWWGSRWLRRQLWGGGLGVGTPLCSLPVCLPDWLGSQCPSGSEAGPVPECFS